MGNTLFGISLEEYQDSFSKKKIMNIPLKTKSNLKELFRDSFIFIIKYLTLLPTIDYDIALFYFIEDLSQEQIRDILNISQSAISTRLKYIKYRINFLLKIPSLNPLQVREDFKILFPDSLFEFAYFYYFELAQNRVKYFVQNSQSGVANKFKDILEYLTHISHLNILDLSKCDKDLMNFEKKKYLALIYLDYFRFVKKKSNTINFICKKNDYIRSNSLEYGKDILS
jgi:predicted DNA-binding protein YlxM (UPF0122 family)